MSITFSFFTSGSAFRGRLKCFPVEPGSVRIVVDDGNPLTKKILTDSPDGLGILDGDGYGTVDYSYGWIEVDFDTPSPVSGTPVLASYEPVEGGCADTCGKCFTNKLRLDLTPGSISGQPAANIASAWARLIDKVKRDVLPIHVELIAESYSEEYFWSIGHRYDKIPSDTEPTGQRGLRVQYVQSGDMTLVVAVPIYMVATYLISVGGPVMATRAQELATYCSTFYSVGKDVLWSDLYNWCNIQWPGWLSGSESAWDINTTNLSHPAIPPNQTSVIIAPGSLATFDWLRMAFVPV